MSDENKMLKLECYRATSDIEEAQRLYAWVTEGKYDLPPAQPAPGAIDVLRQEYETWAAGDKSQAPDWDSELYEIFDSGISFAINSLAYLLDVKHYTPSDGSESLEGDVSGTLANILIAAGYRNEDGDLAKPHEIAQTAAPNEEQPNTWTATRPDAEITVADLERLETKATAAERDQLLTAFEDDHIVERGPLIDAQTCDEVDPRVSWKADAPEIPEGYSAWPPNQTFADGTMLEFWWSDGKVYTSLHDKSWTEPPDAYRILSQAVETDQPEVPDVEETLPVDPLPGFDEADAESDAEGKPEELEQNEEDKENERLRVAWRAQIDAEIVAANQRMSETLTSLTSGEGAAEIIRILTGDAEPTSVLNDPEFQADVERKKEILAQDEPVYTEREIAKHEAAANFWGTALTGDNSHPQDNAKKPFFAFLGAKPKPEEVC